VKSNAIITSPAAILKKKLEQPSRLDNFDEQFEDQFEKE
jgi:hypothetical protein